MSKTKNFQTTSTSLPLDLQYCRVPALPHILAARILITESCQTDFWGFHGFPLAKPGKETNDSAPKPLRKKSLELKSLKFPKQFCPKTKRAKTWEILSPNVTKLLPKPRSKGLCLFHSLRLENVPIIYPNYPPKKKTIQDVSICLNMKKNKKRISCPLMSEMVLFPPTPNSTNSWIGHKDGPSRLIPGDVRTIVFTSRFAGSPGGKRWKKWRQKRDLFVYNPVLRWNFGDKLISCTNEFIPQGFNDSSSTRRLLDLALQKSFQDSHQKKIKPFV